MTIEQLRYFIAVAECKSFSLAAQKVHITQSSLSLSISRFEKELGYALFERSKNGTALTLRGARLLDDAIDIVNRVDDFTASFAAQKNDEKTNLAICTISSFTTIFPAVLQRLKPGFSDCHIRIFEGGNRVPYNMLVEGSADIGIISKRYPIEDSMVFTPLIEDKMVVCLPADHYLANNSIIRYSDLAEMPLAMSMPEFSKSEARTVAGFDMSSQILYEFEKRGVEPQIFISTRHIRRTRSIGSETGCAYFQPSFLNHSDAAVQIGQYVFRELESDIPCIYGSLYTKSHKKNALFVTALQIIEDEIKSNPLFSPMY